MNCCLTGFVIDKNNIKPQTSATYEYFHRSVGNVKISHPVYQEIQQPKFENIRKILAGICRNLFEEKKETIEITSSLLYNPIDNISYPKDFKEKTIHFIKYLYNNGGKEFKKIELLNPNIDFPLIYGDTDEFQRIIEYLEAERIIGIDETKNVFKNLFVYLGVRLTSKGIKISENLLKSSSTEKTITIPLNVRNDVQEFISKGEIEKAIGVLKDFLKSEKAFNIVNSILLIEGKYNFSQRDKNLGLITLEEFYVQRQNIANSILSLLQ